MKATQDEGNDVDDNDNDVCIFVIVIVFVNFVLLIVRALRVCTQAQQLCNMVQYFIDLRAFMIVPYFVRFSCKLLLL